MIYVLLSIYVISLLLPRDKKFKVGILEFWDTLLRGN